MGTLPPTPVLGLVLPNPGTNQPFSTATQNGWMQTIDTAIGSDRTRLTALEANTAWLAALAGIVMGANWTFRTINARKDTRSGMVEGLLGVTYTGSAVNADADGNFADASPVATLPAAWALDTAANAPSYWLLRVDRPGAADLTGRIAGAGGVRIDITHGGAPSRPALINGADYNIHLFYPYR